MWRGLGPKEGSGLPMRQGPDTDVSSSLSGARDPGADLGGEGKAVSITLIGWDDQKGAVPPASSPATPTQP